LIQKSEESRKFSSTGYDIYIAKTLTRLSSESAWDSLAFKLLDSCKRDNLLKCQGCSPRDSHIITNSPKSREIRSSKAKIV